MNVPFMGSRRLTQKTVESKINDLNISSPAQTVKKISEEKEYHHHEEEDIIDDDDEELEEGDYDDIEPIEILDVNSYQNKELGTVCMHPQTYVDNGIQKCQDCAIEISQELSLEPEWRYYGDNDNRHGADPSRAHTRKSEEKSIYKDIQEHNFPTAICVLANEYYALVTNGKIRRANYRKSIIYACVFNAYKQQDNPQIPDTLQQKFGLTKKEISRGLNYVNLEMKKKMVPKYIPPKVFIENIMNRFSSSRYHISEVNALYKRIENRSSSLNRGNPQSVVSGLIFYYFRMLNKDISCKKFSDIVKLSTIIVDRNARIISKILGTLETVKLN